LITVAAATANNTITAANDIYAIDFITATAILKIEGSNTTWINAKNH
jgi:hypothetical protein